MFLILRGSVHHFDEALLSKFTKFNHDDFAPSVRYRSPYFLSLILCFRNAVVVILAGFLIDKVGNPSEFLVEF